MYGSLGYFQWTGGTERKPDPERKVVDVTVKMEEDKQYFLGKLNFIGNDSTRDKVIRREIYMNEGDVFNTEALKMSIKRVNQLGYFKAMESAPDIKPSEDAENKVDVTFKVEEQNRNQFTFGGGVSGYEGAFINASFSTTNFLGAGETFQIYVQSGSRTKNYSLSVSEPYFLDRPITAGVDLFKRKITYYSYANVAGYTQESTGASLRHRLPGGQVVAGLPELHLRGDQALRGQPGGRHEPVLPGDAAAPHEHGPGLRSAAVRGLRRAHREPDHAEPRLQHGRQPLHAARGHAAHRHLHVRRRAARRHRQLLPAEPRVDRVPAGRSARWRSGCAPRSALIEQYGDTQVLPLYQRYFLGGETQIRGYQIRSVGPVDSQGRVLGGNKYGLFNAEYYFDVFGPLRALLFFDAGQAFLEGDPIDITEFRISTGAEVRFIMPVLNVPFRLIYAIQPEPQDRDREAVHAITRPSSSPSVPPSKEKT